MTSTVRKPEESVSWLRQCATVAVLSAPLLLSSTVWILRDRRVWEWDEAWYGQVAIELWQARVQGIGPWLDAMIHAIGLKPPLIVWVGQFFLPLRHLTGSFEAALLFTNLLSAAGTIALIYSVARSLGIGTIPLLAGILACVGSPIFIGLTHLYLVEIMQVLTITAFMLIAVGAQGRSAARTLSLGILIASLALLTKTTSLMFILPLAGYTVGVLLVRRMGMEKRAVAPRWRSCDLVFVFAAVAATAAAATWYVVNWHHMVQHVIDSTTSLDYGSQGSLLSKLAYWLFALTLAMSPFSIISIGVTTLITIAIVVGVVRVLAAQPSHWLPEAIRGGTLFAITLSGTIVVTLLVYSLQITEGVRYVVPVIPMIGVLVGWSLNVLSQRLVSLAFLSAFTVNAVINHAYAHGIGVVQGSSFPLLLQQVHLSAEDRQTLTLAVSVTCPRDGSEKYKVIGVNYPEFNPNSAQFYSAKRGHRCNYASLGYAETDVQRAWDRLTAMAAADYVVTFPPEKQRLDHLNQVSRPIAERLAHDPKFSLISPPGAGLWIFVKRP